MLYDITSLKSEIRTEDFATILWNRQTEGKGYCTLIKILGHRSEQTAINI